MARQLVLSIWCDIHRAQGQDIEGEELAPILLPGQRRARVIALCAACRKELYEPFAEALAAHGDIVDDATGEPVAERRARAERRSRAVTDPGALDARCPVPGCDWPGGTRTALQQHVRVKHDDAMLGELEGKHDRLNPDGSRTRLPFRCEVCDSAFDSSHAMNSHRSRKHPPQRRAAAAQAPREGRRAAAVR